jgi:hypothetical protein
MSAVGRKAAAGADGEAVWFLRPDAGVKLVRSKFLRVTVLAA